MQRMGGASVALVVLLAFLVFMMIILVLYIDQCAPESIEADFFPKSEDNPPPYTLYDSMFTVVYEV